MDKAETKSRKPRKRRLAFSVRAMMALILVLGTPLAVEINRARALKRGLATIRHAGGNVYFRHEDQSWERNDIDHCLKSPPGPRWLRDWIGDEFFETVTGVEYSHQLRAPICPLTDSDLSCLAGMTDIRYLGLGGTRIGDAGLARLARLPALERLEAYDTDITDAGMAHLSGHLRLRALSLSGNEITDAGLRHLRGLTRLNRLELRGTLVSADGLDQLKGLTELHVLTLGRHASNDNGMRFAACQTHLETLGLYNFTDRVTKVPRSPEKLTVDGFAAISGLRGLKTLDLWVEGLGDGHLVHLEGLAGLEVLSLNFTDVSDAGLAHLAGLSRLTLLDLRGTKVTDAGVAELEKSFPALRVLR